MMSRILQYSGSRMSRRRGQVWSPSRKLTTRRAKIWPPNPTSMPRKERWRPRRANWPWPKRSWCTIRLSIDYSKITAPFDGVVTQRYANLGRADAGRHFVRRRPRRWSAFRDENLLPAGDSGARSRTCKFIHVGDPVDVRVPVAGQDRCRERWRASRSDVNGNTRTMHTEVDVPNPDGQAGSRHFMRKPSDC